MGIEKIIKRDRIMKNTVSTFALNYKMANNKQEEKKTNEILNSFLEINYRTNKAKEYYKNHYEKIKEMIE